MITPWLPTVRKIKDGEPVNQATVNVPIDQLTQREQHLFEKFAEIAGKSVLISFDQPIHPQETLVQNELSLVYYLSNSSGDGLARGTTGFSSSSSSSMFTPNSSNYTFGLIKVVYQTTRTADVFTEGLCELETDLDDPVRGLIQKESGGEVEAFQIGPYYLSSKIKGKITKNPSGIPVYVGYAISKRKFLLHTNVDEFSQFFINYRYHILDRVAGIPVKTNNTWTIKTSDYLAVPVYTDGSGSSADVVVVNNSSRYKGYVISSLVGGVTTRSKVDRDTYTITVTAAGNLSQVRFSVTSEKNPQVNTPSIALNGDNDLFVDTNENNNLKLNFTGSTSFVLNSRWTLTVYNYKDRLGWIPAEQSGLARPSGAKFFYNIPSSLAILLDAGLDFKTITEGQSNSTIVEHEKDEALELAKYLPPVPNNFIQLYLNGTLQRYNDIYDSAGVYSVNEYGVWWHADSDGLQPWSGSYPADSLADPSNWRTSIKTTTAATRKNLFVSFSKFNPALRTQLVSSLTPFNLEGNTNAANFIQFYTKEGDTYNKSSTGDLYVDIDCQIDNTGYVDNSTFTYPSTIAATYTADRALAALKYSKPDGKFKAVLTPVVARLIGAGGITVSEQPNSPGVWLVDYASQGTSGQVDSIEPINARLEFRELTSYIKFPTPSNTPYGLIGKIVLPAGYANNRTLRLAFQLFGDTAYESTSLNRDVAFQFEYSVVTAANGPTASDYTIVNTAKYAPAVNPVQFSLTATGSAYIAYSSQRITHTDLVIPAQYIREESIVNFKILRVAPIANSYPGNIGLLATYWEIPAIT